MMTSLPQRKRSAVRNGTSGMQPSCQGKSIRSESQHQLGHKKAYTFVVIGGGISGVCCVKELTRIHQSYLHLPFHFTIALINSSKVLKEAYCVSKITDNIEEIQVRELTSESNDELQSIDIIYGDVNSINTNEKTIFLDDGTKIGYNKLCICTGAKPKLFSNQNRNIIGIRDMESVSHLKSKLERARKVVVLGNGGISLELIHELDYKDCAVVWIVRDGYVGNTFFDATASAFVMPTLLRTRLNRFFDNQNLPPMLPPSFIPICTASYEGGSDQGFGIARDRCFPMPDTMHSNPTLQPQPQPEQQQRQLGKEGAESRNDTVDGVHKLITIAPPEVPSAVTMGAGDSIGGALGPDWLARSGLARKRTRTGYIGNQSQVEIHLSTQKHLDLKQQSTQTNGFEENHQNLQILFNQEIRAFADTTHLALQQNSSNRRSSALLAWKLSEPQEGTPGAPDTALSPEEVRIVDDAIQNDPDMVTEWPLLLLTTANQVLGCDFVVSATGVIPITEFLGSEFIISRDPEGAVLGIAVDERLQTSVEGVYAAGDCCYVTRDRIDTKRSAVHDSRDMDSAIGDHWLQMKLWSQARAMGHLAAHTMTQDFNKEIQPDSVVTDALLPSPFLLFVHVTRFFGFKVVLLGRYNGHGLGNDFEHVVKSIVVTPDGLVKSEEADALAQGKTLEICKDDYYKSNEGSLQSLSDGGHRVEVWSRVTPGEEYIKIIISEGKVVGAMLIGETELEEVFENLILNCLDVSGIGIELLNPDIDIEDYFD